NGVIGGGGGGWTTGGCTIGGLTIGGFSLLGSAGICRIGAGSFFSSFLTTTGTALTGSGRLATTTVTIVPSSKTTPAPTPARIQTSAVFDLAGFAISRSRRGGRAIGTSSSSKRNAARAGAAP